MIFVLSLILFLLLAVVGRERGIKTFFTFFLSILLMIIYVILMSLSVSALPLAIIICIVASALCLFMINGYNIKTKVAFIATIIVFIISFIMIFFIGHITSIQGFSVESAESIGLFALDIHYKMIDVYIGMYLVCITGTVIDTAISISSAMNEVYHHNKKMTIKELFDSGMNVGKDILSTTINTLYFAVISSFIGFFMWHHNETLLDLINYKTFAQDMIQLLLAFTSSILIIPITSYIGANYLIKNKRS